MKLYNRKMSFAFAQEILQYKDYVFIYADSFLGDGNEPRGERIKETLHPASYYKIKYICQGITTEQKICEMFETMDEHEAKKVYESLRRKEMHKFLAQIYEKNKKLVIDFTLMNYRFLGSLVAFLNEFKWEEVYFCYTEPGTYRKNTDSRIKYQNNNMGIEQIPGLETISDSSTVCDWVVFLGFEGSRVMRLEEDAASNRRYVLPYISIPAMNPHWHNMAINANRDFYELKVDKEVTDYVSSIDPFETYQRLNEIKENSTDRLVISPIGSKPVFLGCVMYVLENEKEMLLFDNPVQAGSNSDEYGESHFYDLTQFVRAVKNSRFE